MRLSRYVLANVLRNKRRTALTVLSIGFSLFLLIALSTVLNMLLNPTQTEKSVLRLAVRRSTSLAEQMPFAYGEQLKKVPHVAQVMPFQWYGGYYREEQNQIACLAADPVQFFDYFSEIETTPEEQKAFQADRQAAIVGGALMKHWGWKTGDTIVLHGTIFPGDLELHIVGPYHNADQENGIYCRWDYMNQVLGDTGKISTFWLMADDPKNIPGIIDTVDSMYRNSPAATKTETEKAFFLGFVSMLGNIRLIIGLIGCVVVFTMLLVAVSTMAMTIRERMREVAILKAIGYSRTLLLMMIIGESVSIAFLGWLFALAVSVALGDVDTNSATAGFIPQFHPPMRIYATSLAVCAFIGLMAGLIPGIQAARLTITEAMRKLE